MSLYLVNPSERRILDNAGDRIPIGLLNIASTTEKHGIETKVYDLNHDKPTNLFNDVENDDEAIVGISVYTSPIYPEALQLARRLRPHAKLIAGGYHATAMPESLIKHFDSVVIGEGEQAIFSAIYEDGIFHRASPDLTEIPIPDFSKVDLSKYGLNQSGKRAGTMISSRGCFGNCAFCGKLEKKVRFEPLAKVERQLRILEREFDAIYFVDDVFTVNPKMKEIANYTIKPFRITSRADTITEEKLEYLEEQGCEWLSLGIESGDDYILARCHKGMSKFDNLDAVINASKYGVKTKGFFIIGLPGETEETAKKTIDFSLKLRDNGLTKADFYFMTPFPGTPIWKQPSVFGIEITDRDFTKYLEAGKGARCYINTEELKAGRIEELVEIAKEKWKN